MVSHKIFHFVNCHAIQRKIDIPFKLMTLSDSTKLKKITFTFSGTCVKRMKTLIQVEENKVQ